MRKKGFTKGIAMLLTTALLAGAGVNVQAAAKNVDKNDNISLWVGDSRTVLIYQDLNMKAPNGTAYRNKAYVQGKYLMLKYRDCYAGRGTGYYLVRDGIPKVKKIAGKKGRQNIVFASGVNDIYNTQLNPFRSYSKGKAVAASPETLAEKYWELYKNYFIKAHPEDHFYLMSINPVYTPLYYRGNSVNNSKIVRFNKRLKTLIKQSPYENVSYVNTYKNVFKKQGLIHKKSAYRYAAKYRRMPVRYMKESSCFQLHYSTEVDKQIYQYVNQFIAKDADQ